MYRRTVDEPTAVLLEFWLDLEDEKVEERVLA
jgi:hypothetical protein